MIWKIINGKQSANNNNFYIPAIYLTVSRCNASLLHSPLKSVNGLSISETSPFSFLKRVFVWQKWTHRLLKIKWMFNFICDFHIFLFGTFPGPHKIGGNIPAWLWALPFYFQWCNHSAVNSFNCSSCWVSHKYSLNNSEA